MWITELATYLQFSDGPKAKQKRDEKWWKPGERLAMLRDLCGGSIAIILATTKLDPM